MKSLLKDLQSVHARTHRDYTPIIHMPKCGGTALLKALRNSSVRNVEVVGHVRASSLMHSRFRHPRRPARIVGLIRTPISWYASYRSFCALSLSKRPPSRKNFPPSHPISILSAGGTASIHEYLANMHDTQFLRDALKLFPESSIYGRTMPNPIRFMLQHNVGFFTWSWVYHFGSLLPSKVTSQAQLSHQLDYVRDQTLFLRQEHLETDVHSLLGLTSLQLPIENVSQTEPLPEFGPSEISAALQGEMQSYSYITREPEK